MEKNTESGGIKSVEDLAVVRGKAGSQANTVQDQEDMTHGFDRVKVRNQGAKSTKEMKKLLETRCGVEGTVLDLPLLGRISRIAVWIPPLFMCLHFLVWLFGNARNTERLREVFLEGVRGSVHCPDSLPGCFSDLHP